jgi:hypothetical protein
MMTPFAIVKLKANTRSARAGGRTLRHESPYGNMHCLALAEALSLVERGEAKLLDQFRLARLRADVARAAAEVDPE